MELVKRNLFSKDRIPSFENANPLINTTNFNPSCRSIDQKKSMSQITREPKHKLLSNLNGFVNSGQSGEEAFFMDIEDLRDDFNSRDLLKFFLFILNNEKTTNCEYSIKGIKFWEHLSTQKKYKKLFKKYKPWTLHTSFKRIFTHSDSKEIIEILKKNKSADANYLSKIMYLRRKRRPNTKVNVSKGRKKKGTKTMDLDDEIISFLDDDPEDETVTLIDSESSESESSFFEQHDYHDTTTNKKPNLKENNRVKPQHEEITETISNNPIDCFNANMQISNCSVSDPIKEERKAISTFNTNTQVESLAVTSASSSNALFNYNEAMLSNINIAKRNPKYSTGRLITKDIQKYFSQYTNSFSSNTNNIFSKYEFYKFEGYTKPKLESKFSFQAHGIDKNHDEFINKTYFVYSSNTKKLDFYYKNFNNKVNVIEALLEFQKNFDYEYGYEFILHSMINLSNSLEDVLTYLQNPIRNICKFILTK